MIASNLKILAQSDSVQQFLRSEIQAQVHNIVSLQRQYFMSIISQDKEANIYENWNGSIEVSNIVWGLFVQLMEPLCQLILKQKPTQQLDNSYFDPKILVPNQKGQDSRNTVPKEINQRQQSCRIIDPSKNLLQQGVKINNRATYQPSAQPSSQKQNPLTFKAGDLIQSMLNLFYVDITHGDLTSHLAQFITTLVSISVKEDDFRQDIIDELFFQLTETAEAREFINYLLKDFIRLQQPEDTLQATRYAERTSIEAVMDTSAFGYDLEPLEEQIRNKKSKSRKGTLFAKMQHAISDSSSEEQSEDKKQHRIQQALYSLLESFICEFQLKCHLIPAPIKFFLTLIKEHGLSVRAYAIEKWISRIMCEELGAKGLTYLPQISETVLFNLRFISQALEGQEDASLLLMSACTDLDNILNKIKTPKICVSNLLHRQVAISAKHLRLIVDHVNPELQLPLETAYYLFTYLPPVQPAKFLKQERISYLVKTLIPFVNTKLINDDMSLVQILDNFSHQVAMQNCHNRYLDHDSSKLLTPELIISEIKHYDHGVVGSVLSDLAEKFQQGKKQDLENLIIELETLKEMIECAERSIQKQHYLNLQLQEIGLAARVQQIIQTTQFTSYIYEYLGENPRLEIWDTPMKQESPPKPDPKKNIIELKQKLQTSQQEDDNRDQEEEKPWRKSFFQALDFQKEKMEKSITQKNKKIEVKEKCKQYMFTSIENFIQILKRLKLCRKVLQQPAETDYNWGNLQFVMEDLMEIVGEQIQNSLKKSESKIVLDMIFEYIMRQLDSVWFKKKSRQDQEYLDKVKCLQWITPETFGVPDWQVVFKQHTWQLAIDKIQSIQQYRSPTEKCGQISCLQKLIQTNLQLQFGHEKEAICSADDLIPSLIYILCKAQLREPFAIERYLEVFGPSKSQIDKQAQQRMFFYSAHQFLFNLTHKELNMEELDFEMAIAGDTQSFFQQVDALNDVRRENFSDDESDSDDDDLRVSVSSPQVMPLIPSFGGLKKRHPTSLN